jgi:signal transduction histidine kinase
VRIRLELDPKIPDDLFFSGEIETLILNLVDNAVTAVKMKDPAGKNIWIRTENENDQYRLRVRDDGIGIAEEEQGKIWAPFFSRFKDRPGLGLTICEKIASNHNGQFQVRSERNVFTEFTATFPRPEISETPKRSRGRAGKK